MVQALKKLPQQQQLLICAATNLLGGHKQEPNLSLANQPTTSGLSGLPRKASFRAPMGTAVPNMSSVFGCSMQAASGLAKACRVLCLGA